VNLSSYGLEISGNRLVIANEIPAKESFTGDQVPARNKGKEGRVRLQFGRVVISARQLIGLSQEV
jgi:hypothetical protein